MEAAAGAGRRPAPATGFFNTQYFADPREGVIGILMKQTQGGADHTGWKIRQLVGQAVDD